MSVVMMFAAREMAVADALLGLLRDAFPAGWQVVKRREVRLRGGLRADSIIDVKAPDGSFTTLLVEIKRQTDVRDVEARLAQLREQASRIDQPDAVLVVGAPYLSEATRAKIEASGASYVDSTGNVLLRASKPAMLIRLQGASKDPWPSDESLRSLKGRGAAKAVRALIDFAPPYGVRELAGKAGIAIASLSRTIDLLDRDGLIERDPRGSIVSLDWQGVLRRWTKDYGVESANRVTTYLAPRGLASMSKALADVEGYAATGSFAAQTFSPIAPTRLAALYVESAQRFAERLDLRPADAGANVWLMEPFDDVVFERTAHRDGLVVVAPSQLAADLLTGPGRDPAEGEELIDWMERNQDAWRR